jgi:2-hydroxychromene-2-carboxylate isomerase
MTDLDTTPTVLAELDGAPYDLEFFFDPGCPFAWQTSVWIRKVAALRDVAVGWRFISLRHINADKELPETMLDAQMRSHRYLRVCAAARDRLGNDAVAELYRAFGERFWYTSTDGDFVARFSSAAQRIDVPAILAELGLPSDLADDADDDQWDALIAAESDEAFRRTGPGVGTPIISYDPPHGAALFGPVISTVPDDDETTLALYDALRTLADYPGFSELKRTARPPLDLPLLG